MPPILRPLKRNTEQHRQRRRRRVRALSIAAGCCQRRRQGGGGICGAPVTAAGECARCTRRERGLCARCPLPVDGTVGFAEYCAADRAAVFKLQRCEGSERHRARRRERAA
jgi:hypothetical protein